MKVISSQGYVNWDIVAEKVEMLKSEGATSIDVPCYKCHIANEWMDETFAVMMDKHHTYQAAKQLGLAINYVVNDDPEGLDGDELLEAHYMDMDWYDVEASDAETETFYTVF